MSSRFAVLQQRTVLEHKVSEYLPCQYCAVMGIFLKRTADTPDTYHISLNFDTTEKIPESMLKKIAESYMDKIGFGNQPYLVYQHKDAGHEHLHIVTTNIKPDGKRIGLHNLGRNQSEKARKEIEIDFDLVRADSKKLEQAYQVKLVSVQKVVYGKSDTRRAITNVLDSVLNKYRYTSLPELNAVLKHIML